MVPTVTTLLGGRYKLSGEVARVASAQRAWDRWLDRPVFIKVFAKHKIDGSAAKRRFIESAQALVRIEQPNVEALLDYGATDDGAPYHVMRDDAELACLAEAGELEWARVRAILLDVIAAVDALHHQHIVHRDISLHSVALIGETARLIDFADACALDHEPTPEQLADDVRGIAGLGVALLTGRGASGRAPATLAAALAQTDAPPSVRATLLATLTHAPVDLATLRREVEDGGDRASLWGRSQLVSAAAAVAAAVMSMIGLWSSWTGFEATSVQRSRAPYASSSGPLECEAELGSMDAAPAGVTEASRDTPLPAGHEAAADNGPAPRSEARFEAGRASLEVGSRAARSPAVVQTRRLYLRGDLSPVLMVERGIDLTHGRPALNEDPRAPIVDGPERARALFEAACERDYGKGCHMLGVQIAEGMLPDDGAGPAHHYQRGCALDYPRSCAALADLARAGEIIADVRLLDAKACLLAGPRSSYCLPK